MKNSKEESNYRKNFQSAINAKRHDKFKKNTKDKKKESSDSEDGNTRSKLIEKFTTGEWINIKDARSKCLLRTSIIEKLEEKKKDKCNSGRIIELSIEKLDTEIKRTYKVEIGESSYLLISSTFPAKDKTRIQEANRFFEKMGGNFTFEKKDFHDTNETILEALYK